MAEFAAQELDDMHALIREELASADGPTALLLKAAALEFARYQYLIAMADVSLQEGVVDLRVAHQQFERYADRAYQRALRALREARRNLAGSVRFNTGPVNVNFGTQEMKAPTPELSQREGQCDFG